MSDTPIFHQVLSAGEWRKPLPQAVKTPDQAAKLKSYYDELEASGRDENEAVPYVKKQTRKKK